MTSETFETREPRTVTQNADDLAQKLDAGIARLEEARPFAKPRFQMPVLDLVGRVLTLPGGLQAVFDRAGGLDQAGIFGGSDWDRPATLIPQLVAQSLESDQRRTATIEALSLLRFLSVASGTASHSEIHADYARHFLTQALALNLRHFFGGADEALRGNELAAPVLQFIAEKIGFEDVIGVLVPEIWRILEQRPLQVDRVKNMIAQISVAVIERGHGGSDRLGAERLVGALFGPSTASRDDPGLDAYEARLSKMDGTARRQEALAFARAMHDTGLVSDYHAFFLRWTVTNPDPPLVPEALGLGSTGLDCWRFYQSLCQRLIDKAVHPQTAQAVYGLANLLERGVLHSSPIAPALERQLALRIHEDVAQRIGLAFGDAVTPEVRLLAGVIELMGQPLGIGQGVNPTCQSARALSMWALNDPDFLLHVINQGAQFDTIMMHFEGTQISSHDLPERQPAFVPFDTDPVSVVTVPHLDRMYAEMGRLCMGRPGDPHRWINPEFHGWWVGRECVVAVDVATGMLSDFDGFVRRFYASYNPAYNGGQPVIHPQPAGVAVTDSGGRFVGWHAISILRVAAGSDSDIRVYFFNPNNDSGQDWGQGVQVSTSGNGERHGESSLPFDEFTSRLYLFHDDPIRDYAAGAGYVPQPIVDQVTRLTQKSWAADRIAPETAPGDGLQTGA